MPHRKATVKHVGKVSKTTVTPKHSLANARSVMRRSRQKQGSVVAVRGSMLNKAELAAACAP